MSDEEQQSRVYTGTSKSCGFCKGKVTGEVKDFFFNKCDLCNVEYPIHEFKNNCAKRLMKNTPFGQASSLPMPKITRELFNSQTSVGLLCFNCKRTCFYCNKNHNGG